MSEWQPIETAPMKGKFLVFGGEWVAESRDGGDPRTPAGVVMVNRSGRPKFYVADSDEFWPWIDSPTHWMPLPAPPQTAST